MRKAIAISTLIIALSAHAFGAMSDAAKIGGAKADSVPGSRRVERVVGTYGRECGYDTPVQEVHIVQHPMPGKDGIGRPLYVVLHCSETIARVHMENEEQASIQELRQAITDLTGITVGEIRLQTAGEGTKNLAPVSAMDAEEAIAKSVMMDVVVTEEEEE